MSLGLFEGRRLGQNFSIGNFSHAVQFLSRKFSNRVWHLYPWVAKKIQDKTNGLPRLRLEKSQGSFHKRKTFLPSPRGFRGRQVLKVFVTSQDFLGRFVHVHEARLNRLVPHLPRGPERVPGDAVRSHVSQKVPQGLEKRVAHVPHVPNGKPRLGPGHDGLTVLKTWRTGRTKS